MTAVPPPQRGTDSFEVDGSVVAVGGWGFATDDGRRKPRGTTPRNTLLRSHSPSKAGHEGTPRHGGGGWEGASTYSAIRSPFHTFLTPFLIAPSPAPLRSAGRRRSTLTLAIMEGSFPRYEVRKLVSVAVSRQG